MFFRRKDMDTQAAEAFWNWFMENETMIIQEANSDDMQRVGKLIQAIDAKLTPVFPYEKHKNIQFQLGANQNIKEFFFYTLGKKTLRRDGEVLMHMMPEQLKQGWAFKIEA